MPEKFSLYLYTFLFSLGGAVVGFFIEKFVLKKIEKYTLKTKWKYDDIIFEGHKVIETRARGIDKGIAASIFLEQEQYSFVLAIGDDKTDEDLFKVIPSAQYSIRVGLIQSAAKYNLKQQKDVLSLLRRLQTL